MEIEAFDLGTGFAAAATGCAMDEVGFAFIEFRNSFGKILVVEIDIGGSFDVATFKLSGSANIQDDDVGAFGDEFGGFVDGDVFRFGGGDREGEEENYQGKD